ncbi:MAG: hypothetical protein LBU24_05845 [Methanocalculaceae archaeon]|jgi:hypothetical protein|nr:hypothetical protein [Methanocalculaceae archaeon]
MRLPKAPAHLGKPSYFLGIAVFSNGYLKAVSKIPAASQIRMAVTARRYKSKYRWEDVTCDSRYAEARQEWVYGSVASAAPRKAFGFAAIDWGLASAVKSPNIPLHNVNLSPGSIVVPP